MGITITTPTEEQWPEMFRADARAFGFVPSPDDLVSRRPVIDLSRFRIAVERGRIVGVAGSFGFDVSLPGGATVPMSGITWVSVAPTHRRQGVLTRMMAACHDDTDDRGEPVAMLFASEGGIYERFGYGIATHLRSIAIDRQRARFRADLVADRGAVRFIDDDDALRHRTRIWEAFRRQRPGELTRTDTWQRSLAEDWDKPNHGLSQAFCLAHADGYAMYRVGEKWGDNGPEHRLEVGEVVALTPQAHLELWIAIVGVDLVATIGHRSVALDDPLPYYFTDARTVRTTGMKDGLWVNVRDVAVCFGARTYGTTDKIVVEAAGRRWAIEGDGTESTCRSVRTRPDLVVDQPSLGVLLLGGIPPSQLAAAGRISARSAAVARRADAFFAASPQPHCLTFF